MGKSIGDEELLEKIENEEDFVLIDVRGEKVHLKEHIPRDENVPLDSLDDVELDKDEEIIVYCYHGYLSTLAQKKLEKRGFKNVRNYEGGIEEWKSKGYPVVSESLG